MKERKRDRVKAKAVDVSRIIAEEKLIFCIAVILFMLFFGDKLNDN